MSDQREEDEESFILSEGLDSTSDDHQQNAPLNADDEMLLLSSSPSSQSHEDKAIVTPEAGPSGLKTLQAAADHNPNSNIVIEDSSESEECSGNSVEVIDSEDEEEEFDESDSDESLSTYLDGKVQIFMAQGSFFIWNAEDVQMLREECRIVGKLVGCLPRAPRQNNQLGLPLQLMPEEAKLLEEIEAACVVEELDVPEDIGKLRQVTFEAMRAENYKTQQMLYKENRREEVQQHKHVIIEGKRAKKRKIEELENSKEKEESESTKQLNLGNDNSSDSKMEKDPDQRMENLESDLEVKGESYVADIKGQGTTKSEEKDVEINSNESNSDEKDNSENKVEDGIPEVGKGKSITHGDTEQGVEKGSVNNVQDDCIIVGVDDGEQDSDDDGEFNVDDLVTSETSIKHSLIQLFTENPWKESVKRPKHWIFPLSQKEFLRYEVFRDLWKKGYYLTSGSKFGGDFLVYPGDPARFHSHFIAVCIDKTVDLSALDIISLGRLGSNVRKTVLLCAFNKVRQIVYTSLQWTGIS